MAVLKSLLVTLGLNSAQYRTELDNSRKKTKTATRDMSASFGDFANKAQTAITATTVGIASLSTAALQQQRELERSAQASGMTIDQFYDMALAVQTVGINTEQLGSILGDTEEKIGDFLNTGGGGFQDFADAMGMTKEEARATALEFQKLSGRDVLVEMVRQMENAGLSAEQMNNALEGMGSDARYLIPLLTNNADQLQKVENRFSSLATTLDEETTKELNELLTVSDLVVSNMNNALATALASVSDELIEAAENAAFFWASMQGGTEQQLTSDMARVNDEIQKIKGELTELEGGEAWYDFLGGGVVDDQIERREKRLKELEEQYASLQKQYKLMFGAASTPVEPEQTETKKPARKTETNSEKDISKTFGEMFGGTNTVDLAALNEYKDIQNEIAEIIERSSSQTETLEEKYERESELLHQGISDYEEYIAAKTALDAEYEKSLANSNASVQQSLLQSQANNLAIMQQALGGVSQFAAEGSALAKAAFLASQALAFSQVMVQAEVAKWTATQFAPDPVSKAAMMATIDMQKYVSLALIGAQTGAGLAGMAHDGIDSVPSEGTWLLDKGERVVDSRTNEDLKSFLSKGETSSGSVNVTVQVMGNIYGDKETQRIIKSAAQQGYFMVANDAKTNGVIYKQMRR